MKIDNTGKPLNGPATTRPASTRASGSQTNPASNGDAAKVQDDSVALSSNSLKLSALEGSLASQPVIDSARVNEIRQAIADGKFKINPDAIADKLVASVKELLANRKE